ncbi:MAG TPA: cell division protein FtsZ [Solirubrobacteraceae bacterium]|nr:cell division protein FtsZ [Solirubrobacteraceae bacterium]
MPNGKQRASMREGPLAALFRKTEEAEGAPGQPGEPLDEVRAPSEPDVRLRADTDTRTGADEGQERPGRSASPPPAAAPRPGGAPHPSLGSAPQTVAAQSAYAPGAGLSVPTPQERLREAFNSERQAELGSMQAGQPVIRVVGVGGAGVNAVNRMVEAQVDGIEFLAVNTDLQSLQQSTADLTVHIGAELTRGLGSGSDADVGRQAAMEDYDRVKSMLKGSDMIFIAAGAGGGTGTGAAPILARISREVGALTVAIVTKPFQFEGIRRSEQAERGVRALAEEVDTLIVVPNDRLLGVLDRQTAMVEAFRVADDVLRQGVQGISDLVTLPGLINLDFADVRTIMSGAGNALLGIGMGIGENRATEAADHAISSPLLETSVDGARSILLSITGGKSLSLWEVNEAAKAVSQAAHPEANIIFGAMVDEKLDDQVWVTVVATGFSESGRRRTSARLTEPESGELKVARAAPAGPPRATRRGGLSVDELEVPEFIPNV